MTFRTTQYYIILFLTFVPLWHYRVFQSATEAKKKKRTCTILKKEGKSLYLQLINTQPFISMQIHRSFIVHRSYRQPSVLLPVFPVFGSIVLYELKPFPMESRLHTPFARRRRRVNKSQSNRSQS
jgi:hypothetical protein